MGHTDRVDAELTACAGCGVAVLDAEKHTTVCRLITAQDELVRAQARMVAEQTDDRRNGEVIDAFLASVDCHAIDRAILDGSVDEPFNTQAVVGHLRGLLRG